MQLNTQGVTIFYCYRELQNLIRNMCWVNEEKYFYTGDATAFWIWEKYVVFANALKLLELELE